MKTVGQALARNLVARGVEIVFGIPGVHTIELYRGIEGADIRHITPRHEQGAGFMADGYARVSGKPGVVFVITGPGLVNTLTAMAQARADSVPMLVVTGVNRRDSLGRGLGLLHELPDQLGLSATVAKHSERISSADDLENALIRSFDALRGRPAPVHIEVPTDVMPLEGPERLSGNRPGTPAQPDLQEIFEHLSQSRRPVILAGGGCRRQDAALRCLSEKLDAPVVQTVNARGLMHAHPLIVAASPSLKSVRALLEEADCVLALGTELGPTDYDMYATGTYPEMANLIRIDICPEQLSRHPARAVLEGDVDICLPLLAAHAKAKTASDGAARADASRRAARDEVERLAPGYGQLISQVETLRAALPGSVMVGDSTQAVYAANLAYDHDRPGGWFNGATGFGALGYAIPAAIGAALADPGAPVIALMGDGGAQFTLPELGVASDENLPILFVVWNNNAFLEIANSMEDAGISATGCHPGAPDFGAIASAYRLQYRCTSPTELAEALADLLPLKGPTLLEIDMVASV
ncbi:5-guanidino-2-oxopentanoate decarboxylase [Phaeobacter sp. B1627]|uniref:5-guanidino-2-oxopentanoate decarboxylase n=1 Tax=Phaeobacter sp. B1627 TaxID=2583809 RepID=UPI001118294D|nr:5-guanidino-2-oxopentanoate decarboxylase [Phaeobacter sp. B1627]TNJ45929.1 5-guanidino-2-oxopentanoate decarboxylase [Phaeobacter sp. B1627]